MTAFVLVHGTGHGGWCWQKVARLLRAAGSEVYAQTLTGVGDRSHLLHCGVDLRTHITDVANLLSYEDLSDVVLVGHSYAGMVITGVAAVAPERLKMLVYLDAYVPDEGQSEVDLWPPAMRAEIESDQAAGRGLRPAPTPELMGITDPVLADWARARITPHPFGHLHPASACWQRQERCTAARLHQLHGWADHVSLWALRGQGKSQRLASSRDCDRSRRDAHRAARGSRGSCLS